MRSSASICDGRWRGCLHLRRWLLSGIVAAVLAVQVGCAVTTVLPGGHLSLAIGRAGLLEPAVVRAFDAAAAEEEDAASDPNARAAANCSGGVCTIF
jgi:hypothetical protein